MQRAEIREIRRKSPLNRHNRDLLGDTPITPSWHFDPTGNPVLASIATKPVHADDSDPRSLAAKLRKWILSFSTAEEVPALPVRRRGLSDDTPKMTRLHHAKCRTGGDWNIDTPGTYQRPEFQPREHRDIP